MFHIYTTCGYKMILKNRNKILLAFFYYNSLKVAVQFPEESCYHIFGGIFGCHQTTYLVTFDCKFVRYNDDDLLIFAWRGGVVAKSARRQFSDSRNFSTEGRSVNNGDINCWLLQRHNEGRERNAARREMNCMGWGHWDARCKWSYS